MQAIEHFEADLADRHTAFGRQRASQRSKVAGRR
jgi:hypothetical protein